MTGSEPSATALGFPHACRRLDAGNGAIAPDPAPT
jgi:hypothetical protein